MELKIKNPENFLKEVIDIVKAVEEKQREATKLLDILSSSTFNVCDFCSSFVDQLIKMAEKIFDDEVNENISWFIWETNYGKTEDYNAVTYRDGSVLVVDSVTNLYKLLKDNMEGR